MTKSRGILGTLLKLSFDTFWNLSDGLYGTATNYVLKRSLRTRLICQMLLRQIYNLRSCFSALNSEYLMAPRWNN